MKKKKFFIVTTIAPTLYFFSGQPRLWKEQFDVCAISSDIKRLEAFAEQEGIRYRMIPMHREISLFSDIACLLHFILLFVRERPYIVHGNTPKASMLSMVAAWITRRPVRIYMCHGLRYQTTHGLLLKVLKAMEWLSCHCATSVIGVSRGVLEQLVFDGLCPKYKALLVGYGTAGGVDTEWFSRNALMDIPDKRKELNIKSDTFIFSFVGRIVTDKGINELVKAFDKLSKDNFNVHLLLIGEEEDLDPIEESTRLLIRINKHIHALGRQNDIRPYLMVSDALVLPSYREGLGQVLLEANAMDVPCIASNIIGPRDVITPLVNGELIEAHNTDALYRKMKEWVENREIVTRMSKNCRNYILPRYKTDVVFDAYQKEYNKLADLT